MNDRPLLICYDGSEGAGRAIDVAGTLFHGHSAVVLDVVGLTPEESLAAVSPVVPDFVELNISDGQARARQGSSGHRRRVSSPSLGPTSTCPLGTASSTLPTSWTPS